MMIKAIQLVQHLQVHNTVRQVHLAQVMMITMTMVAMIVVVALGVVIQVVIWDSLLRMVEK